MRVTRPAPPGNGEQQWTPFYAVIALIVIVGSLIGLRLFLSKANERKVEDPEVLVLREQDRI